MHSLVFKGNDFQSGTWLKRANLQTTGEGRDEKWLQELLFAKPDLIPPETISQGTLGYVSVCRELGISKAGGMV